MHRQQMIFITCMFLLCGCEENRKVEYVNPFTGIEAVNILGHKGAGTMGRYGNSDFLDNSPEAILQGIQHLDGVEFDMQLSKDTTLWLFHDHEIPTCADTSANFFLLSDEEIKSISSCRFNGRLISLSGIMELINQQSFDKKKYLSLDIKGLQNPEALKYFGSKKALGEVVLNKLTTTIDLNHSVEFLVEVPFKEQMELFRDFPGTCFALCSAMDDCLETAAHHDCGISLSLQSAQSLQPDKKFTTQLWTPNTGTELQQALALKPDFIQTDNLTMVRFIRDIQEGFVRETILQKEQFSIQNEFQQIHSKSFSAFQSPFFLELSFHSDQNINPEDVLLVHTGSTTGEPLYWEKFEIKKGENKHLIFLDLPFIQPDQKDELKLYFWNRSKGNFKVSRLEVNMLIPPL